MTIRDEKWLAQWSNAAEAARGRLKARGQLPKDQDDLCAPETAEPLKIMTVPNRAPRPGRKPGPMSRRTHALLLAGFTFLFFLPSWLLPALAFTAVLLMLSTWTLLGPDRVGAMVSGYYLRLRDRDEARAEEMRQRAATASAWIGDLLAALPESWTRGLYLPDFEPEPDPHEKLSQDPFERLGSSLRMPMH